MEGQSVMAGAYSGITPRASGVNVGHTAIAGGLNAGMETIGQRVKAERKALRLTQKQLGEAVGLKGETIRDLELGRMASTTKLHRIADVLGVSVSWLETGKGAKTQRSQVAEGGVNYDVRQARAVRPDPVIMASAYKAVLIHAGLAQRVLYLTGADDMALVCDAYAILARGGRVLPGEEDSLTLEAAIRQRAAKPGERSGENAISVVGNGTAAGGKR